MPGCRRNDRVDGNRQRWSSAEGGPAGRCNAGSSIGGLAGGYNTGSSVGSLAGGYNTGSRTGSLAGGYRTGGSVRGYHGVQAAVSWGKGMRAAPRQERAAEESRARKKAGRKKTMPERDESKGQKSGRGDCGERPLFSCSWGLVIRTIIWGRWSRTG